MQTKEGQSGESHFKQTSDPAKVLVQMYPQQKGAECSSDERCSRNLSFQQVTVQVVNVAGDWATADRTFAL